MHLYCTKMPSQWRCASQTGPAFSLGHSQVRTHGLWPAAIQPHVALSCRFNRLHPRDPWKYVDYWHWRNERPSWFTHSRRFTHKVVICQPYLRHRAEKVRWPKTDVLTTEQLSINRIHFLSFRQQAFSNNTAIGSKNANIMVSST